MHLINVTSQNTNVVFLQLSWAGNNINQIAHRLNSDHLKGIISESLYKKVLNGLIGIRDRLQEIAK